MGTTNYAELAWIEETVPGQTPANPEFQQMPINSIGLIEDITTEMDQTIRPDRQTDDIIPVDASYGGDNEYTLSYTPFKPFLISLLQCAKTPISTVAISADVSISAVAATNSFDSGTTDFVAAGAVVGMWIRVAGFIVNPAANNGIHRVTAVAVGSITVDPLISTLVDEAAGAAIDIDGDTYRNSNEVPESYTFKQTVRNDAGTQYYYYYRGQQVNSMSFNFATGAILTGTMNVIGLDGEPRDAILPGEQPTLPIQPLSIMNSVTNLALNITGLPSATVYETFNLTVSNQVAEKKGIGKLGAYGLGSFSLLPTADLNVYFEDLTALNNFKNSVGFLSAFTLADADGNNIVITLPKCKFQTLTLPVEGKDEFLTQPGTLMGVRDPITDCMVQIDLIDA